MIQSMQELVEACSRRNVSIAEVMLTMEMETSGKSRAIILQMMKERLLKMMEAVEKGIEDASLAPSGISGGDALRMKQYRERHKPLSGEYIVDSMVFSLATSENNARMGVIVATPTAGAAGVLPGILLSLRKHEAYTEEQLVEALFTASMLGYIIANRSFISGAAGGCQAEVGSATAMAAGTIVALKQGRPEQVSHAVALALKSMLGLVCDPVAGLVEVPCIKRNAIGTAIAFAAADLALAGVKSRIPCDEVIDTMYEIGKNMPRLYKETSLGGLAVTKTGQEVKKRLYKKEE